LFATQKINGGGQDKRQDKGCEFFGVFFGWFVQKVPLTTLGARCHRKGFGFGVWGEKMKRGARYKVGRKMGKRRTP